MPYIRKKAREYFDYDGGTIPTSPGELNFLITRVCQTYLAQKETSYQTINDVIGALEGAKLEFYRRVVAPYEEEKIKQNGDIY